MIKLYSGRILELAADIPQTERLVHPTATARRRSPLCGSAVTVDLLIENDRIIGFGQDVKACALGQAAASVVGREIVGTTGTQLRAARDQLSAMLKENGSAPDAPFEELKVLLPAREYQNRHASIMLVLDAAVDAFASAEAAA